MNANTTIGLCKKYGNKNVVNNLNLVVPKGAIYGVIGQNGAGKSTTQKLVRGLINASEGSNILIACANIVLALHALQGGKRDSRCSGKVGERHFSLVP